MRELRLYVLDGDEPAGRWRMIDRTSLQVADGELWVTVEGELADHWLLPGETLVFARGMRVWISAGPRGATFAFGPRDAPAAVRADAWRQRVAAWGWRRRQAAASLPT
ncbi:DUF2917 domain-containing protein [Burkholderia sp. Bp8963]|uniref:DUF2917 domain-containing protein n=1 Tax=Burkholderia sp. Bp8963 TaxID=2184547 RepID=UPI000F5A4FA9|nr:DUF2917 domain-containing protein [Burkholderia sp. Bp8963]RQS75088.1 DUF2917 domain-containing protein [Burkholderia sp. Bp8963]